MASTMSWLRGEILMPLPETYAQPWPATLAPPTQLCKDCWDRRRFRPSLLCGLDPKQTCHKVHRTGNKVIGHLVQNGHKLDIHVTTLNTAIIRLQILTGQSI